MALLSHKKNPTLNLFGGIPKWRFQLIRGANSKAISKQGFRLNQLNLKSNSQFILSENAEVVDKQRWTGSSGKGDDV